MLVYRLERLVVAEGCLAPEAGLYLGLEVVPIISRGVALYEFDLPEHFAPAALYMQWFYPAPGANPAGLQASDGLRMDFVR